MRIDELFDDGRFGGGDGPEDPEKKLIRLMLEARRNPKKSLLVFVSGGPEEVDDSARLIKRLAQENVAPVVLDIHRSHFTVRHNPLEELIAENPGRVVFIDMTAAKPDHERDYNLTDAVEEGKVGFIVVATTRIDDRLASRFWNTHTHY